MSIMVTGATGTVGSGVVAGLMAAGADVSILARDPGKVNVPGATIFQGDMIDPDSLRAPFAQARTLFLLNAVATDELSQALFALNVAREAGIERIVYLSVMSADRFTNVPHFSAKSGAERMIDEFDMGATMLRPAIYYQNDLWLKEVILNYGIYPFPIGSDGASAVDAEDIAAVAVAELLRRDKASDRLRNVRINVVGPDNLTGDQCATIWSEVLDRKIAYAGDDISAYMANLPPPNWFKYDIYTMLSRFHADGLQSTASDVAIMSELLGRPPRSYREFAANTAKQWAES